MHANDMYLMSNLCRYHTHTSQLSTPFQRLKRGRLIETVHTKRPFHHHSWIAVLSGQSKSMHTRHIWRYESNEVKGDATSSKANNISLNSHKNIIICISLQQISIQFPLPALPPNNVRKLNPLHRQYNSPPLPHSAHSPFCAANRAYVWVFVSIDM